MKNQLHFSLVLMASLFLGCDAAFGQGPLTPPGAPAPTMKTLDQVQPRIAITNLPIFITQGGSYYLTKSFAQNFTSDAITIFTNNVTLDLCGFGIQQTGAAASVVGIRLNAPTTIALTNVFIKNGFITSFVAVGVTCLGPRHCVFENLQITECGGGINIQAFGSAGAVGNVVRHCRTCDNTGSGVVFLSGTANVQNVIIDCESLNNASAGFVMSSAGNWVANCRASGNANNYVIGAGNREGSIVQPTVNATGFSGSSGGSGTGTTDPSANLSY